MDSDRPDIRLRDLNDAMGRAMTASVERNRRDRLDLTARYRIDIPAQQIEIDSRRRAEIAIRTLKGVGVHGTFTQQSKGGR